MQRGSSNASPFCFQLQLDQSLDSYLTNGPCFDDVSQTAYTLHRALQVYSRSKGESLAMAEKKSLVVAANIESRILLIRGQRVRLDADLAELYGVETGALNRAVKRNSERFPEDFTFQFTADEFEALRCQFDTSSWGGRPLLV